MESVGNVILVHERKDDYICIDKHLELGSAWMSFSKHCPTYFFVERFLPFRRGGDNGYCK